MQIKNYNINNYQRSHNLINKEAYMKNLFIRILSLTLALLMLFAFTACKDEKEDEKGDTPADDTGEDKDPSGWFEKEEEEEPGEEDDPLAGGEDEEEWVYEGIQWVITRGGGCFIHKYQVDGTEYHWIADNDGKTWNWLARATNWETKEDYALEEGTIEVVVTSRANTGVVFGAVGMGIPQNGGGQPTVSTGAGIFYYYAGFNHVDGTFGLYVDDTDEKLNTPKPISVATITDIIPNWDPTSDLNIKVEFTKAGKIKVYLNDALFVDVENYTPYGTQFGMLVANDEGFTKLEDIGQLKSYIFTPAGAEE